MATHRRIRVRNREAIRENSRRNNGFTTAGGISQPIGYTSDLAGLVNISKGIYGGFDHNMYMELDVKGEDTSLQLLQPLFPYKDLIKLYLQSTILRQCVESYKINIEGYGSAFEYIGPEGGRESLASRNELARAQRVVDNITTDGRPLQTHREDSRTDLEILGARAFEVGVDAVGRVVIFNQAPSHMLRMTRREKTPINVLMVDPVTGQKVMRPRRFRRFCQQNYEGKTTWFKEYGDPRTVDPKNGKDNPSLSVENEATSIYYEGLYTPGTPYGTPRWAGAIPALTGSREAEMVNVNFFRDNAIPALAVLVSGGSLTSESFDKIQQYIEGVRGQKSMNRIVVLEATTDSNDMLATDGSLPAPKVDIKPMLSERQHEGLFENYIKAGDDKAMGSFRLPPVYVGSAEEYNRASAFASMQVAEDQIFVPERLRWDTMFQNIVLSTHNLKFWRLRSQGPMLSDPQEVSKIVTTLSTEGGLTPNVAIKLANRYLDADIAPVTQAWGDTPFEIVMEALKGGTVLEGLEDFAIDVKALQPKLPATTDSTGSTKKAIKNSVTLMMDEMAETLERSLNATIETKVQKAIIDYSGKQ